MGAITNGTHNSREMTKDSVSPPQRIHLIASADDLDPRSLLGLGVLKRNEWFPLSLVEENHILARHPNFDPNY